MYHIATIIDTGNITLKIQSIISIPKNTVLPTSSEDLKQSKRCYEARTSSNLSEYQLERVPPVSSETQVSQNIRLLEGLSGEVVFNARRNLRLKQ